jgi:hypothetical protein
MRPYQVYINQEALVAAPRSGPTRRAVMDYIRSLATDPFSRGDFAESDEVGRTVYVKIVGRFAVTFWADHPVSEVKVTHIKPADK